ncbi:guanylyl cyclase 1 [Zea mays]|uniref:Guanylyl cyclase 1 n=1 Tax=Zea mays TaxID=4577 RepID=A0A1D6MXC0_MAIZE|nr:guanylyl cyclase 1 [Zea mays]
MPNRALWIGHAGDNGQSQGPGAEQSTYRADALLLTTLIRVNKVPHVQHAFTWDCGLACVLMVLRTLGIDCCDGIADLERLCRTTRSNCKKTSIEWTSYLGRRSMLELVFKSITAYDIAFLLLSGHCIAIALVDKSKLNLPCMSDYDVQQHNDEPDYMEGLRQAANFRVTTGSADPPIGYHAWLEQK